MHTVTKPRTAARGGLQFGGARADGLVLVGIGNHQVVLVNLVDDVSTVAVDELVAAKLGPWEPFSPTPELRDRVEEILDTPGQRASLSTIADGLVAPPTGGPTRQDFVSMLEQANLDVPAVLPETKSFAAEPDFLASCLSTVVPQMVASGLTVDDPSTFCALMHVERTGLMPRGSDDDAPAAPPEMATDPLAADPLADPMARNAGPVRPQAGGLTQPPLDPPPLALETVPTQPIVEPAPPVAPPLVEPPAAVANVPTGPPTIGKPHKKKNLAAGPTPIGKPV